MRKELRVVWNFAKKYIWLFLIAEICLVLTYIVSLLLPLNLSMLTDDVLFGKKYDLLYGVIFNYVILLFTAIIANSIYAFVWQILSNNYVVDIKNKMFEKVMFAKAKWLVSNNTGDIMSRIDWESDQFLYFIQRNIFHFFNSILLCIGIIYIIIKINFLIALFLVITTLIPIVITQAFSKVLEKYSSKSKQISGDLNGFLFEIVKGIRDIKLHCSHKWAENKLVIYLKKIIELSNKTRWLDFHINKIIYIINLVSSLFVYWNCLILIHDKKLTVGLFLAIIELTALLHRKFNWLLMIYMDWYSRKININRVIEVLEAKSEIKNEEFFNRKITNISFRNVKFGYESEIILEKLNVDIQEKDKIAIIGESGSGKTTINNLLLRFFDINDGYIFVNGKNIYEFSLLELRKKIVIINQENLIFKGTIRENLLLGNNKYFSNNELLKVCDSVLIGDIVRSFPNGLDTKLDDRSVKLSGGQKQRLLIAKLLLKDFDVLILDESTSALDKTTELIIMDLINQKFKDKILIVNSHNKNTFKFCDKIYILKNKKLSLLKSEKREDN